MKIIEYNTNLPDSFLQTILPEDIWKLNPIIAGGSAISLWFMSEMTKGLPEGMGESFIATLNKTKKIIPYSDVDIWFHKDQEEVISSLLAEEPPEKIMSGFNLTKKSYWANTYSSYSKPSCPIQFIKKTQDSVESLISSFDISLSSAAIYKGKFYISDNVLESFKRKEIILNNPDHIQKRTFGSKIFQGLRHFKYAKRFNMSFDKALHQKTIHLFADSVAFLQAFEKNNSDHNTSVKITSSNSNYEETVLTKESLVGMTRQFCTLFDQLKTMKNFSETDLLFIPDSRYIPVGKYINASRENSIKPNSSPFYGFLNF